MNRILVAIIFTFCAYAQGVLVDPLSSRQQATFRQINFLPEVESRKIGVGEVAFVVFDSGATNHEDLVGRFNSLLTKDFQDLGKHATPVIGVAAAITGNAAGIKGIFQQADVVPIRVNKVNPEGTLYTDKEEVFHAIASLRDLPYRLLVVNMSIALNEIDPKGKERWDKALSSLSDKALFVVGAGNDPTMNTALIYPCASSHLSNVVCVGAVDERDGFDGSESSRGKYVTISAARCSYTTTADNGYASVCGTSIATPQVAGAAVLFTEQTLGENPNAKVTPSSLKQVLVKGSRFSPNLLGKTGFPGILDIATSLLLLQTELEEVARPKPLGFINWYDGSQTLYRGSTVLLWGNDLRDSQVFLNDTPLEAEFATDAQIRFTLPKNIFTLRDRGNTLTLIKRDKKGRFLPETVETILENFSPQ